jgi:putative ABC transport system permease protein
MNPWVALQVSYRALSTNKARAILTTLGIIIGVAAVITMVALTQGATATIEDQLTSLGGNSVVVSAGAKTRSGISSNKEDTRILTAQDADAIRKLPLVTHVSPISNTTARVIWNNRNWFTALVGAAPDFVFINDWLPERGNFFIPEDVARAERVCVLGKTVAYHLFGYQNPLGETVRIGQTPFRVIGVLTPKGQTSSGKDQDDIIIIPYTTLQKRILGVKHIENIAIAVRAQKDIPLATTYITQLLREQHQLRPDMPDDFSIKTQLDVTKRIFLILRIMTILLGGIASISLIVGGIGIMNIMLVSVTERTKEIGIRMSVGAKGRDILTQFLIESVVLSLAGGLIGVALGVLGSKITTLLTHIHTFVSAGSILLAFGFAASIGIFFGLYPARKASKLDPIEALRYE